MTDPEPTADELLQAAKRMPLVTDKTRYFECEVCRRTATLTEPEAFEGGWDYPPFLGAFGIITPRTCPECGVDKTAWFALVVQGAEVQDLTKQHRLTITRIMQETDPFATIRHKYATSSD